jgi:GT2 family glycosyltransferase
MGSNKGRFTMDVDCVIIGVNAESTLEACIRSVFQNRYTAGKINVYYVDGGSTDRSVESARGFEGVHIIEIFPDYPTPGLGRNAGWTQGSAPLVQFLDSDTILDHHWLTKAAEAMGQGIGAVRGNREEINPEASVYNWIGNLEWNAPPGECEAFGGDVLIRRSILEETGGYDEILVGGEDPELSRRVRLKGWKIIQLDEPMTRHDLAMTTWRQYWKRAYRTGYAYGANAFGSWFGAGGLWPSYASRSWDCSGVHGPSCCLFRRSGSCFYRACSGLLTLKGTRVFHPEKRGATPGTAPSSLSRNSLVRCGFLPARFCRGPSGTNDAGCKPDDPI